MNQGFRDRREAGRLLGERLSHLADKDVLVLALPRGGVPVAYEIAQTLKAPMDVYVVRKLGVPGHEELAMGAIAPRGVRILNEEIVRRARVSRDEIEQVAARENKELDRRSRLYRGDLTLPDMEGRTIVVVDDGLATGSTMKAAVAALRAQRAARVLVAVPVGASEVCQELEREADEVVCLMTPELMGAISLFYADFSQTSDDEVRSLLSETQGAR